MEMSHKLCSGGFVRSQEKGRCGALGTQSYLWPSLAQLARGKSHALVYCPTKKTGRNRKDSRNCRSTFGSACFFFYHFEEGL